MAQYSTKHLIINSPYEEPAKHLKYHRQVGFFTEVAGRRPAGYVVATPGSQAIDDPGVFHSLPLVNEIRPKVKAWREGGYLGATGTTQRLLEHWRDLEERDFRRFFFCQLEAIETLIWLTEAPATEMQGLAIPGDGGPFRRLCSKMATGSGKTIVMAMLNAWQVLNKVADPENPRYSKNILVVAPGLTVRNRLQVLVPDSPGNYYDEFNIVPGGLVDPLRQAKVLVLNWHALGWDTAEQIAKRRSVDKRGAKSDEAYVREVLGEMAYARNLLVINDEAHHAWRVPVESKVKGVSKAELEEATKWIGALDRIQRARGILACHDFSATPFVPLGRQASEEALFDWIVSDFGLYDAIESGLVKTPRIVVRDDGQYTSDYKSRLYHIYVDPDVRDDLNRKAEEHEPLPDLVTNGYYLLGKDWLETAKNWEKAGHKTPPVMITVANRTETAARVKYAVDHGRIRIEELCRTDRTLHIDSKVLEKAESQIEAAQPNGQDGGAEEEIPEAPIRKLTKDQQAELLRRMVDTVGREGEPGGPIQNVISVGMLSEGWDAKTVTHIMGLRAFSSQLLCEQVVGRGLRRTSYDVNPKTGLFEPEYVNIFGVPFTFLPCEGGDGPPPPPPPPKTLIEPVQDKRRFEINWPNVLRVDHTCTPVLKLDMDQVPVLKIDASRTATLAELAPVIDGKPDLTRLTEIALSDLGQRFRLQKIAFEAAAEVFDLMKPTWKGRREYLLAQLVGLVERFVRSNRVQISPPLFYRDPLRRRVMLTLNMTRIVQHIWEAIRQENTEKLEPVFDSDHPLRGTSDMRPWWTGKPHAWSQRSHVNFSVYDSTWEASEAFVLDHDPHVEAWVKNDHLGFEIIYVFNGAKRKYRPDFLVRLINGKTLVLEVKGEDTQQNETKRGFLDEWCRAVNEHGAFGSWIWDVSHHPGDVLDILVRHGAEAS